MSVWHHQLPDQVLPPLLSGESLGSFRTLFGLLGQLAALVANVDSMRFVARRYFQCSAVARSGYELVGLGCQRPRRCGCFASCPERKAATSPGAPRPSACGDFLLGAKGGHQPGDGISAGPPCNLKSKTAALARRP